MPDATHSAVPITPPSDGLVRQRPSARPPDRLKAQQVVCEIVRQAAPELPGSPGISPLSIARLFWWAHLYFAQKNPGYLTDWPLIRTPWGADLQAGDALLRDLAQQGLVRTRQEAFGPFPLTTYVHAGKGMAPGVGEAAAEAVRQAVEARSLSGWCPALSRSWRTTPDGEELDVYLDLIPEDAFEEQRRLLQDLKEGCGELFS